MVIVNGRRTVERDSLSGVVLSLGKTTPHLCRLSARNYKFYRNGNSANFSLCVCNGKILKSSLPLLEMK